MADYTALLRAPFDDISPEDDDFIARLLEVAKLFRPFSESLDGFLRAQGYGGADGDTEGKVAFLRAAFLRAGIEPPRELRLWYTRGQPIRRETAFQLCFASGWTAMARTPSSARFTSGSAALTAIRPGRRFITSA